MAVDEQNVTQTTINRTAPFMEDYMRKLLESSYQQSQQQMMMPNQQIAGLSPQQVQAANLAQQGIGSYQPFLDQASQAYTSDNPFFQMAQQAYTSDNPAFQMAQQAFDPQNINALTQQFMNPYTQEVVDTTLSDLTRQANMEADRIGGSAVGAGAFGGGRQAIAEQELNRNVADQFARTAGGLRQAGYNTALGAGLQTAGNQANLGMQTAGAQAGLGMQGAGAMNAANMNLANLTQGLGTQDINSLLGIGGLVQGQAQSQLDANRANQLQQMYEPYQRLGYFSDILRGVPSTGQSITSATAPSTTNPFGTALGYGMTGLGIAGQLGYQPFGNPTAYANPYGGGVSPIGSGSGYMS
jgi:hypothetical protein